MKLILTSLLLCLTLSAFAKPKTVTKTIKTEKKTETKPDGTEVKTETKTEVQSTEIPSAPAPTSFDINKTLSESNKAVKAALTESALLREGKGNGVFINYSALDMIIPSKFGGSFYFASSDKLNQYEFQFLTSTLAISSSIDIASMTEQKFSFLNRNFYQGSNFNWYYGLSYATLDAKLGPDYLNTVPPNARVESDMLKVNVLALDLGVGNRWYFENGLIFGVDWVGVSQPVATLKKEQHFTDNSTNQSDKDDVDKFLTLMTGLPRLYILKLQLGYAF